MTTTDQQTLGDGALHAYAKFKSELLQILDALAESADSSLVVCRELREKLLSEQFNVATVGQFKRGKSCLVNALLGDNLLPTSAVPLTSVVTVVSHGDKLCINVQFRDGSTLNVGREELPGYVTEAGNPNNAKGVKEVRIVSPAPLLKDGVCLLDTPGVGSVHRHNTDAAYDALPQCDAALFLLSADQPPGQAELEFLHDVRGHAHRIFFLLNKIDYLDGAELDEALAFTQQVLLTAMGGEVRLFPVSAKLALQGKMRNDAKLLERSRLPDFTSALEVFLLHEKGQVLLLSAVASLARILAQTRLEIALQRQSLSAPPGELKARIEQFRVRWESLSGEKRRIRRHFQTDIKRIVDAVLDPDIHRCRQQLSTRLTDNFDRFLLDRPGLALRELDDALEAFVMDEVQGAFTTWLTQEEPLIAAELEAAGRVFSASVTILIIELQQFSADLLHIPFNPINTEDAWMAESRCRFNLDCEPAGLEILTETAIADWPRHISNRFVKLKAAVLRWANRRIVEKRRGDLLEAIDRQAGRIRQDFLERLEQGSGQFAVQTLSRLEAAAEGIVQALAQGLEERTKSAVEVEQRRQALDRLLEKMDVIGEHLVAIHRSADAL